MDPAKFVVNALAPAIISKVIIDQANRNMEVIVPDDQLSLAIGKRGQNVRLASKLTNWHIDVKSETRYERQKQEGYQLLLGVKGLTAEMADRLYEAGITSLEFLVGAATTELQELTRLPEEAIDELVERARVMMEMRSAPSEDQAEDEAEGLTEALGEAEALDEAERLRAEMSQAEEPPGDVLEVE
jgi:N utilization substance protein A